ncbi:hypothetical protein LSH36_605g01001 [Paralvinella palmiformis]|uniref:Uncharacterized protein n=1 Tax=Paralvinella palmiformis TaxID=53620 RepID=A0AAD9J6B4_9ANNE|nr:hypothetical protein LSH36_605g01001 [Paralvinella palmiformis]
MTCFLSHLQQIEEDENEYNLMDRPSDLLISPSVSPEKTVVPQMMGHRSLFTPLQLLMDAGLCPQYMKAGCSTLASSPSSVPPSFRNSINGQLAPQESALKIEPLQTSVSLVFTSNVLTEDGSHSLDSYPSITLSPQSSACGTTLVSRTSTPVDSRLWESSSRATRCRTTDHAVISEAPSIRSHIDYRKVSWMNGFMMFSCLNRREISE